MTLPPLPDRAKAGIGAALFQGLLAWALLASLAVRLPAVMEAPLKLFGITAPPPPPPVEKVVPRRARAPKREGAASPPNLKARPTEVFAPPPVVPPVAVPPIIAAPKAGPGSDPSAGAAPVPGPGFGSGGVGTGTGSGRAGNGEGGGGGMRARFISGRIKDSDYPSEAEMAGTQGDLVTRYVIGTNGRITRCTIDVSSGSALLDAKTCELAMKRFHFKPARDTTGKRVTDIIIERHSWVLEEPGPGR